MRPAVKYTLGRIGLFVLVLLALWPLDLNLTAEVGLLVKMMIAVLVSAVLSIFVLRRWRAEVGQQVADAVQRHRTERERLRAALAGEDEEAGEGTTDGKSHSQ